MNKAVIGSFPDPVSASRGVNDLKAFGFPGENITQTVREDVRRGSRLRGPGIAPGLEPLKGLIIGALIGGLLGAIAWYLGHSLSLASYAIHSLLYSTVISFGITGAICGLLEGLAAMGPLMRARRFIRGIGRPDSLVSVHTDETHSQRAMDILLGAGAYDVRRGAASGADEFRTTEMVLPETYGNAPVVQREPVQMAPAGETPAGVSPDRDDRPGTSGTLG